MKIYGEGMKATEEGRGKIDFPLHISSDTEVTWNGSILFIIPHDFEMCY